MSRPVRLLSSDIPQPRGGAAVRQQKLSINLFSGVYGTCASPRLPRSLGRANEERAAHVPPAKVQDWPCQHPKRHPQVTGPTTIENIRTEQRSEGARHDHRLSKINHFQPPRRHDLPAQPALPRFFLSSAPEKKSALSTQRPLQTPCLHLTHELHRRLLLPT